jgi:ribosomal protein S18 acetylase RimI-like enzyme
MIRRLRRKEVDGFDKVRLLELGLLIFQALPEFYEKIPLDRESLLLLLAEQVDIPGTEVNEVYGFFEGDSLLGILSVVDAAALKDVQTAETIAIVRELTREQRAVFQKALSGYGAVIEDIADLRGKYLPRVAVLEAARGKGVARALLKHLFHLYGGAKLSLHVARSNDVATRLYLSLGFAPQSNSYFPIRVLVRPGRGGTP